MRVNGKSEKGKLKMNSFSSQLVLFISLCVLSTLGLWCNIGFICAVVFMVAYCYGAKQYIPVLAVQVAVCLISGRNELLPFIGISFVIGIMCAILFRRKVAYRIVFVICCALFAVKNTLLLAAYAKALETDIMSLIFDAVTAGESFSAGINSFIFDCGPAVVMILSMLSAGLTVFLGYKATVATGKVTSVLILPSGRSFEVDSEYRAVVTVKAASEDDLADINKIKVMLPFELWTLSKRFTVGMISIIFCVIVINIAGVENARAISVLAMCVLALPLCVQGFSFVNFLGRTGCSLFSMRILLWAVVLSSIGISSVILTLVGLYDQFTRLRSKVCIGVAEEAHDKSDNSDNADASDKSDTSDKSDNEQ